MLIFGDLDLGPALHVSTKSTSLARLTFLKVAVHRNPRKYVRLPVPFSAGSVLAVYIFLTTYVRF